MEREQIILRALYRVSDLDPQSDTCGPDAPTICENGCIGCVARAALDAWHHCHFEPTPK